MIRFFKQIYLSNIFFLSWVGIILLFCVSFAIPFLFPIAQAAFIFLIAISGLDIFILFFNKGTINAKRTVNSPLSLGDINKVEVTIQNSYRINLNIEVIDELPYQFQIRDFKKELKLNSLEEVTFTYHLKPQERGDYIFNNINVYVSSFFKLIQRRFTIHEKQAVAVYPSILQMKKFELQLFSSTASFQGIKKVRRLGNNNEFEQIKNYVQGDDLRTINWKATSRSGELMVNQYQDERAQQVYCIIDKGRSMRSPFEGLTLLDHAINSSLVLTNIILKKGDKSGLITFSDKLGATVPAAGSSRQLKKVMNLLYHQKTQFLESNFERLYQGVRSTIKGRSLILLYTNFESSYALTRNLSLLRKMSQQHLLVVIFFKNTEIEALADRESKYVKDIYTKTLAGKFTLEKQKMIYDLNKLGIQSILTTPKDLSVHTINKYLEIKSKGML